MTDLLGIIEILKHHPWSKGAVADGYVPLLSEMEIDPKKRAEALLEDMAAIGCDWPIRSTPIGVKTVLSHYEIPSSDFGQFEDKAHDTLTAHGSGLNWGSVIRLSKACEIGRSLFGNAWPVKFRRKLLNPKDHLAFVEEILWLNLWLGISDIESEARPFASLGCRKRIDWRFSSCGQIINLEVKYRPRDWMRHVDGPENHLVMPSYFYDVPEKFPAKNPRELNLVAVTCLASIDRSLQEHTEILLQENPTIDGVIIWAHSSKSESPFEIHAARDRELISTLFTGGDLEDAAHIGIVRHVWRKRDERRSIHGEEVPEILKKLSSEANEARNR